MERDVALAAAAASASDAAESRARAEDAVHAAHAAHAETAINPVGEGGDLPRARGYRLSGNGRRARSGQMEGGRGKEGGGGGGGGRDPPSAVLAEQALERAQQLAVVHAHKMHGVSQPPMLPMSSHLMDCLRRLQHWVPQVSRFSVSVAYFLRNYFAGNI